MIRITRKPTGPGEILKEEFLIPLGITQKQLADHVGCDVKVSRAFLLEIYRGGHQPYQARTKIVISRVHIPQFQPGATVPVRIDPKDPTRVSLDIYEF